MNEKKKEKKLCRVDSIVFIQKDKVTIIEKTNKRPGVSKQKEGGKGMEG